MSGPLSPKLVKGAIVGLDPANPIASVVVFQYNPDTVTRTVRARTPPDSSSASEPLRLAGPPEETISLEMEVDAADQVGRGAAPPSVAGVAPAVAALEMLLYPKSAAVIANEALARAGMIEIVPPKAPLALFIWGMQRVVPVRISEFTITEEAFDPMLNPIRAKVRLEMRVLTYSELGLASPGGALYMAHQVVKEVLAMTASAGSAVAGLGSIAG